VSRDQRQWGRLLAIEAELRQRLIGELEIVARGYNTTFFCTREFIPPEWPPGTLSETAEELSALALQALRLRESLREPIENSVGDIFRQALREANDLTNQHRLGPIRHAQWLLDVLRSPLP
jgi:hypothetical protein